MKNCILINAYPNTKLKIELLREQISNFKSINLPIIVCSGCELPSDLINTIDYLIINREKHIKPAIFQKKCFLDGKGYICAYYTMGDTVIFNDFVDPTITQNIKLLFNLAKFFGFENVIYTEDDNIFVDADDYLKTNLEILNNNQAKMCAVFSRFKTQTSQDFSGIHTNHFFSNVDFLLDNFIFPYKSEDFVENKYDDFVPWMSYECSIFKCFQNHLDKISNIDLNYLNQQRKQDKLFLRDNDINYIINQRFTFYKQKNKSVRGLVINTSTKLDFKICVYVNKQLVYNCDEFNPGVFYMTQTLNKGDTVRVDLEDYSNNKITREIVYNDENDILALQY